MTEFVVEATATPPEELALAASKDTKRRRGRGARPGMGRFSRWVIARGEDGEPVGALSVGGMLGTAEVGHFWVAGAAQRKGVGSRLLQAAEDAARGEGFVHILVRAYDFEAPGFFLRQGYQQLAALPGGPQAAGLVWLAKPLAPAAEAVPVPTAEAVPVPTGDAAPVLAPEAAPDPELPLGPAAAKAASPAATKPASKAGRKRGRRR